MSRPLLRSAGPYALGLAMLAVFIQLGLWQLRRAEEKRHWQQRYAATGAPVPLGRAADVRDGQRVRLSGEWLREQAVLLDNRLYRKQGGFHVLMPLRLSHGGGVVIVNRGWIAAGKTRRARPVYATPAGPVTVEGLALVPSEGYSLGESMAEPGIWQRVDLARFAGQLQEPVARLWVLQENMADDGLVRDWAPPDFGIEKHRGYAFQWFAFAALDVGLMLYFGRRQWRRRQAER